RSIQRCLSRIGSPKDFVSKVVKEEESSFLRTLDKGLKRFETIKSESKNNIVAGAVAFELYDTYGFPLDLTSLIARENGLEVDEKSFVTEMSKQKERSKSAAQQSAGDWIELDFAGNGSEFLGYDEVESVSQITKYRVVNQKGKNFYQFVLDKTPFYAESGGQVGDAGYFDFGSEKLEIFDTKKENDLIIHYAHKLPVALEQSFRAVVNVKKRRLTENNHSATHLLHAALRQVLGEHVQQKGSLVNENVLRFDFSHFAKVTDDEIRKVETIVNQKIRENIALDEKRNVPIEKAKDLGAMALFGEKYGDFVRVITFDSKYSVELCGGTHVKATGTIGQFKILSESSVAAGVRRIEAITADKAEAYFNEELALLGEIKELLKSPSDPLKAIQSLLAEKSQLQKDLDAVNQEKTKGLKKELLLSASQLRDCQLIVSQVELPNAEVLKQLSFELKNEISGLILILAANLDGKPMLSVMIDESIVQSKGLDASSLVREMAREIKGGGGGQPFYATAGGKEIEGLAKALEVAKNIVEEKLNTKV
ncbi:MAG: alanyl-tRNA synthetase, partial [Cyclobacteriaceae bacterium]